MHGLIGGRWPNGQPLRDARETKGQRAVPNDTPDNQRPTSPNSLLLTKSDGNGSVDSIFCRLNGWNQQKTRTALCVTIWERLAAGPFHGRPPIVT